MHRSLLQRRTVRAMLRLLSPNQDVSIRLQVIAIMTAHGLKLHDEDVALALVTLANKAQKMLGVSLLTSVHTNQNEYMLVLPGKRLWWDVVSVLL